MFEKILLNDHFLIGLGLAVGPALIIVGIVCAFFKWGNPFNKETRSIEMSDQVVKTVYDMLKPTWNEIRAINDRQREVRHELPLEYVRNKDLQIITDSQKRVEEKFDIFAKACLSGDCAAGKLASRLAVAGPRP